MFVNGSIWRPPNCTSYLSDNNSVQEAEKVKEREEGKNKSPEPKPVKMSKKGLILNERYIIIIIFYYPYYNNTVVIISIICPI